MMEDNYRHKGMRREMLAELRELGITDERVLEAMDKVPRHLFLPSAFLQFAYQNRAFEIGAGQTISHPFTVAFQTQLLEVKEMEKVLEIGTGSGYQTSVLKALGARVFTIERQRSLYESTSLLLGKLGVKAHLFFGDGYKGVPAHAPFDKILITCGAPRVPEALLEQLKPGGKLIVPIGSGEKQEMTEIIRLNEREAVRKTHGTFSFVPMLEKRTFGQ
jgi:protein-L-isoaspartate(D-aspartate) O-methyltransferase